MYFKCILETVCARSVHPYAVSSGELMVKLLVNFSSFYAYAKAIKAIPSPMLL